MKKIKQKKFDDLYSKAQKLCKESQFTIPFGSIIFNVFRDDKFYFEMEEIKGTDLDPRGAEYYTNRRIVNFRKAFRENVVGVAKADQTYKKEIARLLKLIEKQTGIIRRKNWKIKHLHNVINDFISDPELTNKKLKEGFYKKRK